MFDGELLKEEKELTGTPKILDHDYVMQPQRSPASSDSGVSLDSSGNSPRNLNEDLTQFCTNMISLSESPDNDTAYYYPGENSPGSISDQLSVSPGSGENMDLGALDLENFDFSEVTGMNLDTVDPSALDGSSMDGMDENVSIDIGIICFIILHVNCNVFFGLSYKYRYKNAKFKH